MTQKKRDLINRLKNIYPYSQEWFDRQPEARLWAMLMAYKPKLIEKDTRQDQTTTIIDGDRYILTDAGNWELIVD